MLWRLAGPLIICISVASAIVIVTSRSLLEQSGLHARYWTDADRTGSRADFETVDRAIATDTLVRRSTQLSADALAVEWRGYLLAPRTAKYKFAPSVEGDLEVRVDDVLVSHPSMPSGGPTIRLTAGVHEIALQYRGARNMRVTLLWAAGEDAYRNVGPLLLVPKVPETSEQRIRILLTRWRLVTPFLWLALIVAGLAWGGYRLVRSLRAGRSDSVPRAVWILTTVAVALFSTGAAWGVPDYSSWAPDELSPAEVLGGAAGHVAGGWATIYPPAHFISLATLLLPFHLAAAGGLPALEDLDAIAAMLLVARGLSVLMAAGTILLAFRMGREVGDQRSGLIAAAVFAVTLPLTYYAKTANLDVPYVFWLAAALFYYLRSYRSGLSRDFYLFTIAGVTAICTKDQAYGFFVLPALYMVGGAVVPVARRPLHGIPPVGVLLRMTALGAFVFAVLFNLPVNAEGLAEHIRLITGPASENYRMYPGTLGGQGQLAVAAWRELAQSMSLPLLVSAAIAVLVAIRRTPGRTCHLLLPAISYYLFFIAVVGYVYDRFLLGIILIIAVAAAGPLAVWIAAIARNRSRPSRWRLVAFYGIIVFALARCVSLDILMLEDSRYEAEDWLRAHVMPGERVAAVGQREYLPRASMIPWTPLRADLSELNQLKPELVIVNAAFSRRSVAGTAAATFYQSLRSGAAGYRMERVFRTSLRLPLGLERRFREPLEDPFSNLSKINPPIEVYRRYFE